MCIKGREENMQNIQCQWLGVDSIVVSSFSLNEMQFEGYFQWHIAQATVFDMG